MKKYLLAVMSMMLFYSSLYAAPSVNVPALTPTHISCTYSFNNTRFVPLPTLSPGAVYNFMCGTVGSDASSYLKEVQVGVQLLGVKGSSPIVWGLICSVPTLTCVEVP